MTKQAKQKSEIEFHPDAWERFERAAGLVAKAPPQHRKRAESEGSKIKKKAKKKPG